MIPLSKNRRKKVLSAAGSCLAVFLGIFTFSTLYADSDNGPYPVKQRPDVMFVDNYHDMHMDALDCLDCHHDYKDGENVLEQEALEDGEAEIECASCHTRDATLDLTKAFHQQCMGCHNKMKKEKEKTGPCLCGECHIKKVETP